MIRTLLQLFLGLLPASPTKNKLLSMTSKQWSIHPTAQIAPNFLIGIEHLDIREGAVLRLLNVLRGLYRLEVQEEGEIAQLNWISGAGGFMPTDHPDLRGTLIVRKAGMIGSRHFVDCSGGVVIGAYGGLAGYKTTIMSHSVDVMESGQKSAPVIIGDRTMIAVGCIILAGVTIAEKCVVAAGTVVAKDLTEPETMYGGSPAKPIASIKGAKLLNRDYARITTEEDHERMKAEVARTRGQR